MKKALFAFILTIGTFVAANAQKFAYVSSDYILENVPEYKTAMEKLDQISGDWQKEVEAKYAEIDKMYKTYQAEQVLLTDEMKRKREDDIIAKEKEAKELQKSKFGVDGELFKKKQELVKPIQDRVYNSLKKVSADQGLGFVFDKSSDLIMLYANEKYDISDLVLIQMGLRPGKKK